MQMEDSRHPSVHENVRYYLTSDSDLFNGINQWYKRTSSSDSVYTLTTGSATFSTYNKRTTLFRTPGKTVREYMVSDLWWATLELPYKWLLPSLIIWLQECCSLVKVCCETLITSAKILPLRKVTYGLLTTTTTTCKERESSRNSNMPTT